MNIAHKPYVKPRSDRFLKQLSIHDRRYQEQLRLQILTDPLFKIV